MLTSLRPGPAGHRGKRDDRDERGVAMVVVAILVVLCATVSMVVASSTMFGTRQTANDRSRLQALAAAEAGRDATLAAVKSDGCGDSGVHAGSVGSGAAQTGTYRAQVFWVPDPDASHLPPSPDADTTPGCPSPDGAVDGYLGIASQGRAADGATTKSVFAWYRYTRTVTAGVPEPEPPPELIQPPSLIAADGAILEGGGSSMNVPSVVVKGDVVLGAGSFDCNGNSVIDGDLILPKGGVDLSNNCKVTGSIIAHGNIYVHNLTNQIGHDVVSTAGTVKIEGAQVGGSVKADGGVQLNNSVQVGGDVIARGNGATDCKGSGATGSAFTGSSSAPTKTVGGSVRIGGAFCQADLLHVTGSIIATGSGTTAIGGVGTVSASAIKLAGDCKPCTATPTPQTGQKDLTPATFTNPAQIGYSTWLEIPWKASTWEDSNWTVQTATASQCDYQSKADLVTAVDNLTTPTVIDASACGTNGLNLYGVTFSLQTDVTFIAKAFSSAQNVKVNVSGAGSRTFNLIVPDADPTDHVPTCPTGSQSSTIYGATLSSGVSGIAYSPCTLAIGTVTWTGQLMAGYPDPAGGNANITYQAVGVPGASTNGGGTTTITPPPVEAPQPVQPPPPPVTATSFPPTVVKQTEPRWTPSP